MPLAKATVAWCNCTGQTFDLELLQIKWMSTERVIVSSVEGKVM